MYHRRLLLVLLLSTASTATHSKEPRKEHSANTKIIRENKKLRFGEYTRGLDHRHKSGQERVFCWISLTSLYAHSRVAGGSATKNSVCAACNWNMLNAWSTKKLEKSLQLWDERSHRSTFCCRAEPRDQQSPCLEKKSPPRTPMAAAFTSIHSCKCRSFHLISCIKSNHQDASFHLNLFSYRRKKKI